MANRPGLLRRFFRLFAGVALLTALQAGVSAFGQGSGTPFKHENRAENLKALCQDIHKAVTAKDTKRAAALVRPLLPDEARIKKGLREDVPAATLAQIVAFHKKLPTGTEADLAKVFAAKPDQTEVQVHAATTEELRKYAPGSVAYKEFPGGAQKLAETVLRPGMTYYEVEFLKPGAKAGIKYHLFYWDGSQWTMLGPVWRVSK